MTAEEIQYTMQTVGDKRFNIVDVLTMLWCLREQK